ncbi:MAG: Glu/Leu/Phe/Val family dehydrogenase, partial [Planctomycetota bacterium]
HFAQHVFGSEPKRGAKGRPAQILHGPWETFPSAEVAADGTIRVRFRTWRPIAAVSVYYGARAPSDPFAVSRLRKATSKQVGRAARDHSIDFDPRDHDRDFTEKAVRRYTAGVIDLIGPERDILFPDLHCDEQIMAWCLDTYSMHKRHTENAVVVGKPAGLGGTQLRDSAIGRGVRVVMEKRLADMGITSKARVVIQGAGTVAGQVARELVAFGHSVIAMGDVRGAVFKEDGLDVPAVLAHRRAEGTVVGFGGSEAITRDQLLALDCDVLVPAAVARQITHENAATIQASLVVEAANGPTTRKADEILQERGIPVVPDLLGNAGAILIAYFEWVQNRMGYLWSREEVESRLDRMILEAYERARKEAGERKVGLRLATCMLGVERVAYFDRLRGIYG